MVLPGSCHAAFTVLRQIESVVVLEQLGSSLFDTALQMVVKDRSVNATYTDVSEKDSQQKFMTDFFLIYNLIIGLTPILPAMLLARLGDRGWRRAPIMLPLSGYLLSRLALLLVVLFRLPLEVMYGAGVVFGLSGGFCAYWPGVMTLASLGSTAKDRSKVLMRVELLYGAAGLVGSLVSGHLFLLYSSSTQHGSILLSVSTLLHLLCLLHSITLLQVKPVPIPEPEDACDLLPQAPGGVPVEAPVGRNMVNVALLFVAAMLYVSAVGGAIEILGPFVLKEPLSWSATQVGYGNAAGCTIFLTSFLGVMVFRRYISDTSLILIGMLSFASGIYFMSFVTATYMFYLARSLTLFALIPMPTIRSLLSQQVPASSCGTALTSLQLALKFASLAYLPAFTKIYQQTLGWFPGFVFTLSSIITVLGMIPICVIGCRSPKRQRDETIQED
ncbi:thymic stromal cotransporter homolog [Notothenia coriiceps]|uniref:Thymic stromal cotransporter homolog n=1 Tax=Notothenia coriiceps TaxID=8208 RepID=A0A6I9MZW6_9TELE|nr:PREDICTED: thymic stromal cotransporter homolog [Notothenia coriiceps]